MNIADITVVIPTFQRPDALPETLQSLQQQTLKGFEVIVADNDADNAEASQRVRAFIEKFNADATTPATYLPEPRRGVHYARNTAAKRARGELLLFTDDDMSFVPRWVEAYRDAFAQIPGMAAAAGPIHLKWDVEPPGWLRDYIEGMSTNPFGYLDRNKPFDINTTNGFHSGNMAIKKSILIERGGFHPEATGAIWIGDGETGLNIEMWDRGDLIGYVPDALNFHHIPTSRMSVKYLRRRWANEGAARAYTSLHKAMPSRIGLAKYMSRVAARNPRHMLAGWLYRDRTDKRSINIQMRSSLAWAQFRFAGKVARDSHFRELVKKDDWMNE